MNMKNKGFTLVELIITIALIAAISVTVGLSMTGLFERQEEKELDEYIETIEKAACVYAISHNVSEVSIDTLIRESLLRKDLVNPKTNEDITKYGCNNVLIKWQNYEKSCSYNIDTEIFCNND